MKTSTLIIAAMLATSTSAMSAECFFRSTTGSKVTGTLSLVSDIKYWITPTLNKQKKCIATFKALDDKKQWHNGVGEYTFSTSVSDDDGCALAIEQGKAELINRVYGSLVDSTSEMVCNETEPPKTRPVQIGEEIQISDVSIHPNKQPFKYKGTFCQWFVETSVSDKDLYQWQGIVCKTGRPGLDTWTVVDKF